MEPRERGPGTEKSKMADNYLVNSTNDRTTSEDVAAGRREFIRRSALIGIPAILATVNPRTVWGGALKASDACARSAHPSGCKNDSKRWK